MPRRKVVGNPEYIEILEEQKAKLASRDPTSTQQYTYGRAIKSLMDTPEHQAFPGEIKVKFVGPTIVAFLKAELAKGRHSRPVNGYDSLVSSSGSSSDPLSAADAVYAQPRLTAKQKGKGKAHSNGLGLDAGLHAIAGKFGNAAARQHADHEAPKQPSEQALSKAAAVEEAILVGLYTQCDETSQKIWQTEKELLMLAEPWMTHQTKILAPRLVALTTRKHLEVHVRGNIPVYSFTWEGFRIAEVSAKHKGLPAIKIVQNDLMVPEVQAPAPAHHSASAVTSAGKSSTSNARPPEVVEATNAITRPKGIVSVPRNAPIAGNFATIVPRKRAAPVIEDTYQGLSQYTRAAAEEAAEPVGAPAVTHRPVNKRFAAPTVASVYRDKPAAPPATHSDVLAFHFAYLDENDNRIGTSEGADVKPHPDNGTLMYKVEYRARQARHPLAKIVQDKMPMVRNPPDPEGLTECGWIAASKAPAKCPGFGTSKSASRLGASGAVPVKKASKSSTIASLMSGSIQNKKTDTRAMYKFPSLDTYDFGSSSSPEKPRMDTVKSKVPNPVQQERTVPQSNGACNAALMRNIFGSSSSSKPSTSTIAASVAGPSALPSATTRQLATTITAAVPPSTVLTCASGYVHVACTSSIPPLPGGPQSPPVQEGYSRSYSWALEDHVTFPAFDPVVLAPETFHVVMQIDHRELLGSASRGTLESFLRRRGINYEVVNLVLGDYLWIARRKIRRGDGCRLIRALQLLGPADNDCTDDEVVLAICERKRKDDFIEAIKNERHVIQKRRINAAGVKRCFYLVEEIDISRNENAETFTKSIQTSINQTLLIDGFSLHIANTYAETMAHLARVTLALVEEASPLHIIPDARVQRGQVAALQRYLERKNPQMVHYTSLSSFHRTANITVTIQSLWATQIRHVSGMSEEQCVYFLDVYPTPVSFFEDLEYRQACEVEAGRGGQTGGALKKRKKLHPSDVLCHVKNKVEPGFERPRPMPGPTTARLWNLSMTDNYADCAMFLDE